VRLAFTVELFLFLKCYILLFHRLRLKNLPKYAVDIDYTDTRILDSVSCEFKVGTWSMNRKYPVNYIQNVIQRLVSRSAPYAEEITGDHQCQLWSNRSTTDHVFCIRQILLASQEGIRSLELCSRTFALYETEWMS
jgi:hypothetical protein